MAGKHADDAVVPVGAVPSQDWKGQLWLGSAYQHETNKVITTGREVFSTVTSLLVRAQEEWMTVRPPSWVDGAPASDPVPLWPIPDADKVRVRAIYDSSYPAGPMERSFVCMHVDLGEEARVFHGIDVRMLIADGTVLLVVPPDTGLLVTDRSAVKQYRRFFEGIWKKSLPFSTTGLAALRGWVD